MQQLSTQASAGHAWASCRVSTHSSPPGGADPGPPGSPRRPEKGIPVLSRGGHLGEQAGRGAGPSLRGACFPFSPLRLAGGSGEPAPLGLHYTRLFCDCLNHGIQARVAEPRSLLQESSLLGSCFGRHSPGVSHHSRCFCSLLVCLV